VRDLLASEPEAPVPIEVASLELARLLGGEPVLGAGKTKHPSPHPVTASPPPSEPSEEPERIGVLLPPPVHFAPVSEVDDLKPPELPRLDTLGDAGLEPNS